MRLVLVISSLSSGGAERVMSTLANAWCSRGRDVTILTTHDKGREPDYALDPRVRIVSVDPRCRSGERQIRTIRRIRRQIRAIEPDAVISFLSYTNIIVLLALKGMKVPVVVSERIDPSVLEASPIWSFLRRLTYPWADILVAQTRSAASRFEPLAPGRVRVIPNPVLELSADPGADDAVSLVGPTFLAVGRLEPQKGLDVLIRALALVRERAPEWRLVILGEGDSRNELERLVAEHGLGDAAFLPGRVRNPWPWLKAADIYVMSSRREGFPNALCEAMIAGRPVISTDCPSGPAELIEEGRNGLLVAVEDVQALADGMLRLGRDPQLRDRLAAQAKLIGTKYELTSVLELWDEALSTALQGRIQA